MTTKSLFPSLLGQNIMQKLILLSALLLFTAPLHANSDLQIYFADEGTPEAALLSAINECHQSVQLCMYSFTDRQLGHALIMAGKRGVNVQIILDQSQTREKNSEAAYLERSLGTDHVQLRTGRGGEGSIMHNKFAIFDGERVATGSYNWTTSARNYNYENLIILSGAAGHEAAPAFDREFKRIWTAPPAGY